MFEPSGERERERERQRERQIFVSMFDKAFRFSLMTEWKEKRGEREGCGLCQCLIKL